MKMSSNANRKVWCRSPRQKLLAVHTPSQLHSCCENLAAAVSRSFFLHAEVPQSGSGPISPNTGPLQSGAEHGIMQQSGNADLL